LLYNLTVSWIYPVGIRLCRRPYVCGVLSTSLLIGDFIFWWLYRFVWIFVQGWKCAKSVGKYWPCTYWFTFSEMLRFRLHVV